MPRSDLSISVKQQSLYERIRSLPGVFGVAVATGVAGGTAAASLMTGGVDSYAAPLLIAVPVLGMVFGGKPGLLASSAIAMTAALSMPLLEAGEALPVLLKNSGLLMGVGLSFVCGLSVSERLEHFRSRANADRDRFTALSHYSRDLLTRHDASGRTLFVSVNAKTHFDFEPEQFLNSGFTDKIHLQDRVAFLKAIQDSAATGEKHTAEIRMRRTQESGHSWRHAEIACFPHHGMDKSGAAVTIVTRDISGLAAAKAENERLNADLVRTSEAKRNFLGHVSHELRTPLNAIVGFSDVLSQETFGSFENGRQREYVKHIHESGHHLLSVVNTMLDLSRLEVGKYELNVHRYALDEVIKSSQAMLEPMRELAGVKLDVEIGPALDELRGDPNAVRQIVLNLVSNAIKFSEPGSSIGIKARPFGPQMQIEIRDSGIGMSREFQNRIGRPFEQADNRTDRAHEGVGLGLSVVKGLVDLLDGSIEFTSEVGEGTVVTVALPRNARGAKPKPSNEPIKFIRSGKNNPANEIKHSSDVLSEGENNARESA